MSFATRHSKGSVFQCNTDGFKYFKLSELYSSDGANTVYPVQGLYINRKSEYGDAPVAICAEFFVNLPEYMMDEVTDILHNETDINDIKAGKVGFTIEPYEKEIGKKTKTCYGLRWCDLND